VAGFFEHDNDPSGFVKSEELRNCLAGWATVIFQELRCVELQGVDCDAYCFVCRERNVRTAIFFKERLYVAYQPYLTPWSRISSLYLHIQSLPERIHNPQPLQKSITWCHLMFFEVKTVPCWKKSVKHWTKRNLVSWLIERVSLVSYFIDSTEVWRGDWIMFVSEKIFSSLPLSALHLCESLVAEFIMCLECLTGNFETSATGTKVRFRLVLPPQ
jgi:hypothetical protein